MFAVRFKNKILTCFSSICTKSNFSPIRCISNTETLEPIDMSYATYESTNNPNIKNNPFLILHGLFGSKSNWNSMCKYYNQKCDPPRKIIAVDTRNHGDSPHNDQHTYAHLAADIKALYGKLNIKKAVLMGHSMGGRAVMLFALKYPELVERLIVADISPASNSPNLDSMPNLFKTIERVKLPTNIPMSQCRTQVDMELSKSIDDKGLRAFLLTNLVEKSGGSFQWRINIPGLIANFNCVTRFPVVTDLQYDGPTLFVGGNKSDYMPKSDFPKIQKLFPNAEMKYIEGAGHWLHSEKPAEFLAITLEFLNRRIQSNEIKTESSN